jgi:hypothetical protein
MLLRNGMEQDTCSYSAFTIYTYNNKIYKHKLIQNSMLTPTQYPLNHYASTSIAICHLFLE